MRSWSRRSDPDASKRSKVPEHPPIAPPTGPSAPSVIEGLSTVEVRWILPGQLDAAVAGWFGRFPAGLDSREDIYLIDPVLRGLSVKIRAGQVLEVKATGPAGSLRSTLEDAAALMFAQAPPGEVELDMGHCQSYAECLSRHRVTAAIHPREGEESPARRRQNQSPSYDSGRKAERESDGERGIPWLI